MDWQKNDEPRVAIVVISWNGLQDTIKCLTALQSSTYENWRAVLVDNASQDGTVDAVQLYFADIHIIANESNLGYAVGNNQGIQWAIDQEADWILLLNNDVFVKAEALAELVRVGGAQPDIGIVGPVMQRTLRPDILDLGGDLNFWWGRVNLITQESAPASSEWCQIDYVWGCALMARRQIFEQTNGLKKFYVAYFEDAELCITAQRLGFRTVVALNAYVEHHVGRSGEKRFVWQTYLRARNHAAFFLRFAKFYQWPTLLPALFFIQIPMILLHSLRLFLARTLRRQKYADRRVTLFGYQPTQPDPEVLEKWLDEAGYSTS